MADSIENLIEYQEVDQNTLKDMCYQSSVKGNSSFVDVCKQNDVDPLDATATIVFTDFCPPIRVQETDDNRIGQYNSHDKFWHYKTIMEYLIRRRGLSCSEIADISPVTRSTIRRHARDLGAIGKRRVEWDIPSSWEKARTKTVERDGECLSCGMSNEEHIEKYDRSLTAHHVVPRRMFDEKRNADSLDNLVALCQHCHQSNEYTPRELFKLSMNESTDLEQEQSSQDNGFKFIDQ